MPQQTPKPWLKYWIAIPVAIAFSSGLLSSCGGKKQEPPDASSAVLNPEKISAYAQSILSLEPHQMAAYEQMKAASKDEAPPKVVCDREETVNRLRGNQKKIAVGYCNKSKEIVESHQLTVGEFNTITQQLQDNADVKKLVSEQLVNLKKTQGSTP
jgi:Domain of unknown function (DUF4168)